MPTYDYKCNACDHRFELFQSMSEGVKRKCPECGKLKLERLIGTGSALIFKGSGFYETDYRSKDYAKAKEAESKAGTEKTKSDDSKPKKSEDAKPKKSEKTTDSKPKAKTTSDA
ncbi:MAG: zinc ribbon domain-containing protein [bacterium]|nr:zinc ribbon domain-containing protein [bacterium]